MLAFWKNGAHSHKRNANRGDASAQFNLGVRHEAGDGVPQDYEEAARWYRKAAEQGNAGAQCSIAACYEFGRGVLPSLPDATAWYRKAAEQGVEYAIGFCHQYGAGCPIDPAAAFSMYTRAIQRNDGDLNALYKLGWCYENGFGVAQDFVEAVKLYRRSAEGPHKVLPTNFFSASVSSPVVATDGKQVNSGRPKSMFIPSSSSSSSSSPPPLPPLPESREQNTQTSGGRPKSMLVTMQEQGQKIVGMAPFVAVASSFAPPSSASSASAEHAMEKVSDRPKSMLDAVQPLQLQTAVNQGNAQAQSSLGICYEYGRGVSKDIDEAFRWYHRSADQANALGQFRLGQCFENGTGVSQNYATAAQLYLNSAKQGFAVAQFHIAECYKHGRGIPTDHKEAFEWYRKASDQRHIEAQFQLAEYYREGRKHASEDNNNNNKSNSINNVNKIDEKTNSMTSPAAAAVATAQGAAINEFDFVAAIKQDYSEAFTLYCRAAENKHPEAQYRVGELMETGRGIFQSTKAAYDCYHKAAVMGLAVAQCKLAHGYRIGEGVEKDDVQAVTWYKKAADQGNIEAMINLGDCFASGIGVPQKDHAEAVKWLAKAAERGYQQAFDKLILLANLDIVDAQIQVGICFENGHGVERDAEEALKWYQAAAEQGSADAQCRVGESLFNGGRGSDTVKFTQALVWFHRANAASEQGHATAQYQIGLCHSLGCGVDQNRSEAAKWYEAAARNGNRDAMYSLGLCFENGDGREVNHVEAARWYSEAANRGVAAAAFRLGVLHENGSGGIVKDMIAAIKWYRKAAGEHGHAEALYQLGKFYDQGRDGVIPQNYALAARFYGRSAEQGHIAAYLGLGGCLEEGKGIARNPSAAIHLYREAHDRGSVDALIRLGKCYENGVSVGKNYTVALEWYNKAKDKQHPDAEECINIVTEKIIHQNKVQEEQERKEREMNEKRKAQGGNIEAQYNLGCWYSTGDGVEINHAEAFKWFQMAAGELGGHTGAQYSLGLCYETGKGVEKNWTTAADWYTKSAEKGNVQAQTRLGACFEFGRGRPMSLSDAAAWYSLATKKGSEYALGFCYEKGVDGWTVDAKAAFEWYTKACERNPNDADVLYKIAWCLETAFGTAQDVQRAAALYLKLAQQDHAMGQKGIGFCLLHGHGTSQDTEKAVEYFKMCANQGNPWGHFMLAKCYEEGSGVTKDVAEAEMQYTKAAELGHADAQCEHGLKLAASPFPNAHAEALHWMSKAAQQYHIFAMDTMGYYCEHGIGAKPDDREAVKWYRKAAERGNADSQCSLALFYETGKGVNKKDLEEAFKWYRKAAEQGNSAAQCNVARCFENGLGVEKDEAEAAKYYRQAVDQGSAYAMHGLGNCYQMGTGVPRDYQQALELYRKALSGGYQAAEARVQEVEGLLRKQEREKEEQLRIQRERQDRQRDEMMLRMAREIQEKSAGEGSGHRRQVAAVPVVRSMPGMMAASSVGVQDASLLPEHMEGAPVEGLGHLARGHVIGDFELMSTPAVGVQNAVARVKNVLNDREAFMKFFKDPFQYTRELNILKEFNKRNVHTVVVFAPVLEGFGEIPTADGNLYFIVTEMLGRCVTDYFQANGKPYSERSMETNLLIEKLLLALLSIHEAGKVHGDVKPMHFLCNTTIPLVVKMIDFDNCNEIGFNGMDRGTPAYFAPEILNEISEGRSFTAHPSGDIWAAGLVVYELVTGTPLWKARYQTVHQTMRDLAGLEEEVEREWLRFVVSDAPIELHGIKKDGKPMEKRIHSLLSKMLVKNPIDRLSLRDILKSSAISGGDGTYSTAKALERMADEVRAVGEKVQAGFEDLNERFDEVDEVLSQVQGTVEAQHLELARQFANIRTILFHVKFQPAVPRTFFIIPNSDPKTWVAKANALLNHEFTLHFMCETCSWYDSSPTGGFKIRDPKEFVRKYAPYVAIGFSVIKAAMSAAPLVGGAVNHFFKLADNVKNNLEQVGKASGNVSWAAIFKINDLAKRDADKFPVVMNILEQYYDEDAKAINKGDTKKYTKYANDFHQLEQLKDNEAIAGSDFENHGAFYNAAFLTSVDSKHQFGGLHPIQTEDGTFKWCCKECMESTPNAVHMGSSSKS